MGIVIYRKPRAKDINRPHPLPTDKYNPIRSGNSLLELKKWIKWSKSYYPKTKNRIIILDLINQFKSNDYWMMKYKSGKEHRYIVYEEK